MSATISQNSTRRSPRVHAAEYHSPAVLRLLGSHEGIAVSINRREFVRSAAGIAAAGVLGQALARQSQPLSSSQTIAVPPSATRPALAALISSGNGMPAVTRAFELLKGGTEPLDAVIGGINVVEDDPNDHSVGLGGLPNEDGVVELDSCVMHGPTHRSGAVGGLQKIKNPSRVAALVARRTDHCLLVGEGALRFAKAHGFKEEELLTDDARKIWLEWKETHSDKDAWLHPESDKTGAAWGEEYGRNFTYGTITCMALTAAGDLFGCTSTSGLSYKIPGRVGDSPIIGAGLYVDNAVGACGSTGRGEANIQNLSSFLIVELMRAGRTPNEASLEALRRVAQHCEKRLLNPAGEPKFGLTFYAIRKDGMVGGASMRNVGKMAYHDGTAARVVELPCLYKDA